jgi:hypothetical protein
MRDIRLALQRAIKFADGVPDVSGLPCDKISRPDVGEYMRRFHLEFTKDRSIRFHEILASDPGTDLHDHPWDFVSVMLNGTYDEVTPTGTIRYEAPCVIMRKAEQLHRLILPEGPAWTYVVCGRVRRRWGLATANGWVPHSSYKGASMAVDCEPKAIAGPSPGRRRWLCVK